MPLLSIINNCPFSEYTHLMQFPNKITDAPLVKDELNFVVANENIKTQMENNLKLLKSLTNAASLLNITNEQILSIQDTKVVILDIHNINHTQINTANISTLVTMLQPQKESRQLIAKMYNLNYEQRRAFTIITEHLDNEGFLMKRTSNF